ncbi:MAG: CvpA family protein [Minwuia sp.]|nr:CvpA family protein [Minwuia sp.]
MSLTFADLIILGIIALSAIFGLMRGFTREVLSLGSWIGAGIAAWYGQPYLRPLVLEQVGDATAADIISAVAIFLVVLVILIIITHSIASRVRESRAMGALDRSLGLLFGIARGGLVIIAAWLVIDYLMPDNPPSTVRDARSLPYVKLATDYVTSVIPRRVQETTRGRADDARGKAEQAGKAARVLRPLLEDDANGSRDGEAQDASPEKGYTKQQNRDLDRLMDSVTERE